MLEEKYKQILGKVLKENLWKIDYPSGNEIHAFCMPEHHLNKFIEKIIDRFEIEFLKSED